MHRSFLMGVACGASVTAAGLILWPSSGVPVKDEQSVHSTLTLPTSSPAPSYLAITPVPPLLETKQAGSEPVKRAPPTAASVTQTPFVPAVVLSAEHAKMLALSPVDGRPSTPPELHAQLATQPKDPEWSFAKEQSIRKALSAANTTGELDVMSVDCRESLCEVLAFGNLPDSGKLWQKVWRDISDQPWHSDVTESAAALYSSKEGGRATFALFLQRSKP